MRRPLVIGGFITAVITAIGACIGLAVQLNHPFWHHGPYWLTGGLIGLAVGLFFGAIAVLVAAAP